MNRPVFPDDFVVRYADGGASFWWWSPDGLEPVASAGLDLPPGLMISSEESVCAEFVPGESVVVGWFVNGEDGPQVIVSPEPGDFFVWFSQVREAVSQVLDMVERERHAAKVADLTLMYGEGSLG